MGRNQAKNTVPLSQFLGGGDPNDKPNIGEIWWTECSVRKAIISVARSVSTHPISSAMESDLGKYYHEDAVKARPCIIVRLNRRARVAHVVPLSTFSGVPILKVGLHAQHLAVSVGETTPWPSKDSHVIQPTPSWPLSRRKPCYAISNLVQIHTRYLRRKYIWPVPPPPGTAVEDVPAAEDSEVAVALTSPTSSEDETVEPITLFYLHPKKLLILEDVIENRAAKLRGKSRQELQAMNDSYS